MSVEPAEARTAPAPSPKVTGIDPRAPEGQGAGAKRPESYEPPPAGMSNWWVWLLVAALAGGGWYYREQWLPWISSSFGRKVATKGPPRPVPVRTAKVQQRDLPLLLDALGTVTAIKTVTLRSRVDGEVMKVAFSEGQVVQEGQVLAEIDTRPFEAQKQQAEGQLARDQANLKLARIVLSRSKELLKKSAIAQQTIDEQTAQVQQLEGTVKASEGILANAQLQITYSKIVAPITGRIGLRLVDQGNTVRANDPNGLAVITQLQPISVVFTIPQDEIPRVLKQTKAGKKLAVDAFNRDFRVKLATGKLQAIDNQIDATTGTLRLKANFDNEDGLLFPNQFVNARLLVDTRKDAILVPTAAVQRGPNDIFVYVVNSDDTVDRRIVELGPAEGGETSITSGLKAGEVVVIDGVDKLTKDSKVTVRESEQKSGKGKNKQDKSAAKPETPAGTVDQKPGRKSDS